MRWLRRLSAYQIIGLGFGITILIGTGLLLLPISVRPGVNLSFFDALFTSASTVCVTALLTVDLYDTFSTFGLIVITLLMQLGGLGIAATSVGLLVMAGRRVSLRDRNLVKEALNLDTTQGIVLLVKGILYTTLVFEALGTVILYFVFIPDYQPLSALGMAAFHAIAAFTNTGSDLMGGFQGVAPYHGNVAFTLTIVFLVIIGGLGFFVITDIVQKRFSFSKLRLHSKVVLVMTAALLITGTLLLKLSENFSWLDAFFYSASSRTSGFAMHPISSFTTAGLFAMSILMFIGASPGSTGSGIKTTTFFTMLVAIKSAALNHYPHAFKRKIPNDIITKAFIIFFLATTIVAIGTFLLCAMEPQHGMLELFFEVISSFATAGFSTGITAELTLGSKVVLMVIMFIGRLGALTVASLWMTRRPALAQYSEESLIIG